MVLFKQARTHGTKSAFLLAVMMALTAPAHSLSITGSAGASQARMQAALRQEEPLEWLEKTLDGQPEDPWKNEQLISPEDLLNRMSGADKPFVLHIGIASLFKNGRIPGSKYAGQGSTPEGIEKLKQSVQGVPKNRSVVLYCGCCPWKDCPNIRPTFKALREMGFARVMVLNLPNSFSQDWISKGLPVERGEAGK